MRDVLKFVSGAVSTKDVLPVLTHFAFRDQRVHGFNGRVHICAPLPAVTFNTTDLSVGVTRGTPTSRIFVDRPNVYNVQFSAQLDKTAGGVGLVWIWLRKNGVNVSDSAGQIRIQGNNAEILAAWNYVIQLNAGDYIELMWEVDDTSVILLADAASAVHPSIPSVILTVTDNLSSLET
jgi:hypothetical protein